MGAGAINKSKKYKDGQALEPFYVQFKMNKTNSFMSGSRSYAMINETTCNQHQGEVYTNFCSATTCVKPLCPECVESHYDFHREMGSKPEMQSFKTVKGRCFKKLRDLLDAISRQADNYGISRDIDMSKLFESSVKKIKEVKESVDKIVKSFFANLEDTTRKKMTYFMSDKSELSEKLDKCESIVKELENLIKTLDTPSMFLDTVEKTIRLEANRLIGKMGDDYQQIQQMRNQFEINVNVDRNLSVSLQNLLSQSIYLGQGPGIVTEPKQTSNIRGFLKESPRHSQFNEDQSKYTVVSKKVLRESREREDDRSVRSVMRNDSFDKGSRRDRSRSAERPKRTINVIGLNTFKEQSQRKYLHFFQNDDNFLHLLDLSSPGNQFVTIKLDNSFKIPYFHKSISTPNGDLYLIGGSIPNSTSKSQKIYKYDFDNRSLNYCTSLKYGRSSHSLCFNNRYIYVVGGFLSNQVVTNKCERYDILSNKTQEIEPCTYPVNSLSLVAFNGRYIFKFGGIGPSQEIVHFIEKYDQKTSKWKVLDPVFEGLTSEFVLLSTSAAAQITPNEIIVFGGYDDQNKGYKQSYVFLAEGDNYVIKDVNMYPLPTAQGFWNNTPIIHNKTLYALQNIATDNSEDCIQNDRRILAFDGRGWKILN